jgi:SAM-dependent methyltransferase
MSSKTAAAILRIFGPCRVIQWHARDTTLLPELLLAGCDAYATGLRHLNHPRWFATDEPRAPMAVVDLDGTPDALAFALALARRNDLQGLILLSRPNTYERQSIERALFARGWRRHPMALQVADYEGLSDAALAPLSAYQRLPPQAESRWPVESLLAERNHHMDMLRESGCRADAHLVRYALAASHVRPGDTVLDCACGLGYGAAIIAAQSRAAMVLGFDLDAGVVAYAQENYGDPNVIFAIGDAASLDSVPDASVDVVVSMETLEHIADWRAAAKEFARVLKPDGRLIASVPDRWMDETGKDPNPYHHHVFDWARLREGLIEDFIIERRYVQAAPGGFKLTNACRTLRQTPLDQDEESEWVLVVASANPFARAEELREAFVHPAFGNALAASGAVVVDFGRFYDNPWLYRTLVQMGERVGDDGVLGRLATWASEKARPGSADQGAALCVAGYLALGQRQLETATALVQAIDTYRAVTEGPTTAPPNPHVQRWRLSLAFLAGRLSELAGSQDEALRWFSFASNLDWRPFSPVLATKTIAAAFHAARISLARGDEASALTHFRRGLNEAIEAARGDVRDIVGSVDAPIAFGLTELAEVMDMGGQCATAIALLPLWRRSPGLFWSQVDMKRFGLATWTRDVEMENNRLRQALEAGSH